jgi:hypothetical protein
MSDEQVWIWKEVVMAYFKVLCYPDITLET